MSRTDEHMAMLEGELDNLRHRVAQLEEENKRLRQNSYGPLINDPTKTTKPWTPKSSPQHPEFKKECPKCGIKIDGLVGYSCPDSECPIFFQPKC